MPKVTRNSEKRAASLSGIMVPRQVLLQSGKKVRRLHRKEMAKRNWMQKYNKSITAEKFLERRGIRNAVEPHMNATYTVCRTVVRNPTESTKGLFMGGRKQSSVLQVIEVIVKMHDNVLVRTDAVAKKCSLHEFAVQVFLWNFMTYYNCVEPKEWFAMPLPLPSKIMSRLRTAFKLHKSCEKSTSLPLDKEACRSYYSFLELEDEFFEDLVTHDDLGKLQYKLLTEQYYSLTTCLTQEGWTNITYNLTINKDKDKELAIQSKEWMKQNLHAVIPEVGRAIAFLYCAGIEHNDLAVRNIIVTTPHDCKRKTFRVGIVDFRGAELLDVDEYDTQRILRLTEHHLTLFVSSIYSNM